MSAAYDQGAWIAAWGGNKPLICNGANDVQVALPRLPEHYGWLLTREVTGEHPTYRLSLMYGPTDDDFAVKARGRIDKKMYGEAGVYQLARSMMERLDIDEPTAVSRTTRPRRADRGVPEPERAAGG